ncbi:hypothetical protein KY285_016208 [Solanum tuberosum]|nr:hypothetical protein KY284_016200 [Solanum tuberosum]KAH0701930.1 hypothetical protein KY285_016208 [Solanum tuberosum]
MEKFRREESRECQNLGPILLFISFSFKSKNKFNFAIAFKKISDVSCKDSTVATFIDFSDVDPITQREFKTSAFNGAEYFTSMEMARKSKYQMTFKTTIPGANIASTLFDEHSHSNFNFGESKNLVNSSISTNVNSLMVDATDMDEKFSIMEQTIGALKKSIDDKNLQIAQLISKLDLYNSRETHHNLTSKKLILILPPSQLTLKGLLMPTGYQPPKLQQFDRRGNPRQHIAHFVETCNSAELATRAHDMELSIASHRNTSHVLDPRKDDTNLKETLEYTTNESMAVTTTSTKASMIQKLKEFAVHQQTREVKNRSTLKELQAKEYPFSDSDVHAILDGLLTKKVIVLPESKRPKKSNKVDDPMYCKFHRIIGHHTTKCFILKEKIRTLVREGKIIIDDGEAAETNSASVKLDHK